MGSALNFFVFLVLAFSVLSAGKDGLMVVEGRSLAEVSVDDYPDPGANPGHQPKSKNYVSNSDHVVGSGSAEGSKKKKKINIGAEHHLT